MAKERIIRASNYLQLDGVTDQTVALQGLLDQALTHGPITLLLDGMAAVTGLRLHSNTTLLCPDAGCGLFLLEDSDQPLLQFANPHRSEICTENIAVLGGSYRVNCFRQMRKDRISQKRRKVFLPEVSREDPEQAFVGFRFIGVRNLTVRDVTLEDHQSCGMLFCNWENVSVENVYLEVPDPRYCQSLDSLHILQPGQQLSVNGLHFRSGSDEYLK